MSQFVITGMPRAGTAWLSVFLTYRDTVCRHDLFSADGVDAGANELEYAGFPSYGVSDCGVVLYREQVAARWPDARWVILTRDTPSCRRSLQAAYGLGGFLLDHSDHVESACRALGDNALVVPFEQVFERADEIAAYCNPRWIPDRARTRELVRMNIQVAPAALYARVHGRR